MHAQGYEPALARRIQCCAAMIRWPARPPIDRGPPGICVGSVWQSWRLPYPINSFGRNGGRVDAQRVVVGGPPDDLFPPVAEDIGAERGRRFGAVVRDRASGGEEPDERARRPVPFADPVAISTRTAPVGWSSRFP